MKVLAVLTYKKYVVLDVPDVAEPEINQSRQADWEARYGIINLAEEKAKDAPIEWEYSDYYRQSTDPTDVGITQDGIDFESVEWFDN